MKIGIFVDSVLPQQGGGYSYTQSLLYELAKAAIHKDINIVLVSYQGNEYKQFNNFPVINLNFNRIKLNLLVRGTLKVLRQFQDLEDTIRELYFSLIAKKRGKLFKKIAYDEGIDIMFYPGQMQCLHPDIPFIATNWDLMHLTEPYFPEVTSGRDFSARDKFYREVLPRAMRVFAESKVGKQQLVEYLNINESKIKVVPIFPGNVVNTEVSIEQQIKILKKVGLEKDQYFFYPAQYWAHKNHANLLKAFAQFHTCHKAVKFVFTGSDKGNLSYIKSLCKSLKIANCVLFQGFVSTETIFTLYKNAIALVMPTFSGPTNMPIVEAMAIGCPVLCSNLPGHQEQVQEYAMYFDPCDYQQITKVLFTIYEDSTLKNKLSQEGKTFYHSISDSKVDNAVKAFFTTVNEVQGIRYSWSNQMREVK